MKVNGILEVAQLETVAGEPALRPAGRVIRDSAASNKVKVSNGTTWDALQFEIATTTVFDAGSSGKAKTIDWNNGTSQIVLLTDNCIFTFANPRAGMMHSLIVRQAAFNTTSTHSYNYAFAMPDQHSRHTRYQPMQISQPGQDQCHSWIYKAGVMSAANSPYQFSFLAAPTSTPSYLELSADGQWASVQVGTTPFVNQYSLMEIGQQIPTFIGPNAVTFTALGGVSFWKFSPSGKVAYNARSTALTADSLLADGNRAATMGTTAALAGTVLSMDLSPDGSVIAVGMGTTPFIKAYKTATPGFNGNTGYTNPATLPGGNGYMLAWSPVGDYIALVSNVSPYLQVWAFDYITSFGSQSVPSVAPAAPTAASANKGLAWHPFGNWIAMITATTPFVAVFPFDRNTGVIGTQMSWSGITVPAVIAKSVQFSPCGNFMSVVTTSELYVYPFNPATGVTANALTNPGLFPVIAAVDHAWTAGGDYIIITGTTSPYHIGYVAPMAVKNYLKYFS